MKSCIDKMNKSNVELRVGSVIEFKKQYWIVYDYCKNCRLAWFERLGKKGRGKYSEVKLKIY